MGLFAKRPVPVKPGPGQESVWEYPRPPRVEEGRRHVRIVFGGQLIYNAAQSYRVLETSHPPVYYVPVDGVTPGVLHKADRVTFCEFKGQAHYYHLEAGGKRADFVGWFLPQPFARL